MASGTRCRSWRWDSTTARVMRPRMRAVKRERSDRTVSWVVKLLVAGMARSVPAMVGSEQLASFAMLESGLLVMAMVVVPRAVASRRASEVSADWEMTMKQGFLRV